MPSMRASLEEIVERVTTIPSLPEVTTKIARMAADPNTSIHQLQEIMSKDAAMASKMLRLVNSAVYGLPQQVTKLDQALGLLGFKTIRSIAMSISVINMFQQQQAAFNMRTFWFHSAVCGGLCRSIAKLGKFVDPETAFTIGLLKDIGKLVLVENAPEETKAIIAVAAERRLSFTQAAREVIDTDDVEVATWLCGHWELEPGLIQAIRFQHDLVHSPQPKLTAMCMLAEHLCALRKLRVSGCYDEPQLDPAVWSHLGVDKAGLAHILTVMNQELEEAKQLLSVAG
jgi:HD-like signal output (HDOD) protein